MIELSIIIKGDDSTFKQKFLLYDVISMDPQDPTIQKCLAEALDTASITPEDIKIKTTMVI